MREVIRCCGVHCHVMSCLCVCVHVCVCVKRGPLAGWRAHLGHTWLSKGIMQYEQLPGDAVYWNR